MKDHFNLLINKDNSALEKGDLKVLEEFRFSNGYPFPNSYKEYVQNYGYGVTVAELIIYIPMQGYGDCIFVRSDEIKSTINHILNDIEDWELEPDGTLEILKNLYPFACSANGNYLLWDIGSFNNGEYDIYLTDFRGIGYKKIAKNLYECLDILSKGYKIKEDLPFAINPSPKSFNPLYRQLNEL